MLKHCITDVEIAAAVRVAPSFQSGPKATTTGGGSKKKDDQREKGPGSTLLGLIELVNGALTSPRYAALALPHVLSLARTLFNRLRLRPSAVSAITTGTTTAAAPSAATASAPAAATLLSKTLVLIGKQREDSSFEWKREAESVLDAAIRVLGPERVLQVLPLGLGSGDNPAKARAWLLPLLKPSITNTRLGHFKTTFVVLSGEMFDKASQARAGDKGMEAKVWETLVAQIWALLPGYCEYPVDLVTEFDAPFLALLANVIYSQPTLRPSIFKALSTLLTTTSTLAASTSPPDLLRAQFGLTPAEGRTALAHLQSLASSLLGVAFNVYGQLPRGEGAYILTTVGEWLAVLPEPELVATYDRVESLLVAALAAAPAPTPKRGHGAPPPSSSNDSEDPGTTTHALLDILIALIPHAAGSPVAPRFWDLASSGAVLGSTDAAVQKKGYRILARLAEERAGAVVRGQEGEVLERLVSTLR